MEEIVPHLACNNASTVPHAAHSPTTLIGGDSTGEMGKGENLQLQDRKRKKKRKNRDKGPRDTMLELGPTGGMGKGENLQLQDRKRKKKRKNRDKGPRDTMLELGPTGGMGKGENPQLQDRKRKKKRKNRDEGPRDTMLELGPTGSVGAFQDGSHLDRGLTGLFMVEDLPGKAGKGTPANPAGRDGTKQVKQEDVLLLPAKKKKKKKAKQDGAWEIVPVSKTSSDTLCAVGPAVAVKQAASSQSSRGLELDASTRNRGQSKYAAAPTTPAGFDALKGDEEEDVSQLREQKAKKRRIKGPPGLPVSQGRIGLKMELEIAGSIATVDPKGRSDENVPFGANQGGGEVSNAGAPITPGGRGEPEEATREKLPMNRLKPNKERGTDLSAQPANKVVMDESEGITEKDPAYLPGCTIEMCLSSGKAMQAAHAIVQAPPRQQTISRLWANHKEKRKTKIVEQPGVQATATTTAKLKPPGLPGVPVLASPMGEPSVSKPKKEKATQTPLSLGGSTGVPWQGGAEGQRAGVDNGRGQKGPVDNHTKPGQRSSTPHSQDNGKRISSSGGSGEKAGPDRVSKRSNPVASAAAPMLQVKTSKLLGTVQGMTNMAEQAAVRPAEMPSQPAAAAIGSGPERTGATGGTGSDSWAAKCATKERKQGSFSREEKQRILEGVKAFGAANNLDTEDLSWALETRKHKGARGVWMKVTEGFPNRTPRAVQGAGTRLLHSGNNKGKWSTAETMRLLELVEEHGNKWAKISRVLGRMADSCRDHYREVKARDTDRTGKWSPEEEDKLREIVHTVLDTIQECRNDGDDDMHLTRMFHLDGIDWEFVADMMGTRNLMQCRKKWYSKLSTSLAERGLWGDGEDRKLLDSLLAAQPEEAYQIQWGALVGGRSAKAARHRWNQLVKWVPNWRDMEFPQLVNAVDEVVHVHEGKVSAL